MAASALGYELPLLPESLGKVHFGVDHDSSSGTSIRVTPNKCKTADFVTRIAMCYKDCQMRSFLAAKRRKNKAHGVSRGCEWGDGPASKGRQKCAHTDS